MKQLSNWCKTIINSWSCYIVAKRQLIQNDQLLIGQFKKNYQAMIKYKRNECKTFMKQLLTRDFVLIAQNSHWTKQAIDISQSLLHQNKASLCGAFKLSLTLGPRFLMYNISENSNLDQLQQVSRTQKLEITTLTKCCLLLITVVEASMSGNRSKSIVWSKCSHFNSCLYIGWSLPEACSFNLATKLQPVFPT